ncbi:MarR family winged helix-turn-helix transcriptional regulator [Paenibacillus terrae]|uniref:MarR family transcriptional regulator n=1 Tax=Paenibacillus terrae TaxID=159743 RepID=A0A0D7X3K2_9BACL|nr:MarR family transcriptional regulator [Paenibacillus terrae]KJD45956.1 MarR family transcriptional regulator [Paenibacillus terrae]
MEVNNNSLDTWLSLVYIQIAINEGLERALQEKYDLSLKEFYVLYFLSQSNEKKLRIQQLEKKVGLSQSAVSRLVNRMEAKSCGALQKNGCEMDRRGIYTHITPLGEVKLKNALETFNKVIQTNLKKEELYTKISDLMKTI